MSIVNTLDSVTEWVQENICNGVTLKAPPESDQAPTDAGYEYKRVTPTAFPLFVPLKDKLPPAVLSSDSSSTETPKRRAISLFPEKKRKKQYSISSTS